MHKKDFSSSRLLLRSALIAVGFALSASPVQAGFQWVAPPTPEQPAVVIGDSAGAPAASGAGALPPVQIIEGRAPAAPAKPLAAPSPASVPAGEPVKGFANEVPLSVALQQLLPEGTGFSVAQDVSLSSLVSWKGGAPWRQVMADMLAPHGLAFKEQGGLVQIVRAPVGAGVGAMAIAPSAGPKDAKAPVALLPSAQELPVRTLPDRNMPDGKGGVLGAPSSPKAPAPVAPSPSPTPLFAPPQSLASTPIAPVAPAATDTVPYTQDNAISSWTANKGDTLQSVLEDWCNRANVELSWQAEYDYPLQASVSLSGSFESAVRTLLAGFQEASPQPTGYLYNNQVAGQTVLVVQVRGNSYNE